MKCCCDNKGSSPVPELTGSAPEPVNGSTAGLIHSWKLSTAYYQATIPIWIDEIQELHGWLSEFSSPDAGEAVTAVGAWVYCFRKPVGQEERVGAIIPSSQLFQVMHIRQRWS